MLSYIIKERGNVKKAYKMYKASKKIKEQDLFNPDFYLKKYPNVKEEGMDPLIHYLYHGYKEGKQPGKLFDNNFYLRVNEDVKQSGENPLVHYVLHGKKEGRKSLEDLKIKKLNKEVRNLKTEIKRLKRENTDQGKTIESYNKLFSDLYIYHETTPKGTLKDMQDLCLEMMIFLDNICKKYDIQYWLDYGSLLGPVRHGGFLPWDDDVDLGMIKSDFNRLLEAVNKEIEIHNLEGYVSIREKKKYNDAVTGFIQILCRSPVVPNMLAGIDILPYEYLKNDENLKKSELRTKISDQIAVTREKFLEKDYFNTSPVEANEELNKIIGIVDHEDEYIIPSAVNLKPKKIRIYKSEEMFPLQRIKFEQCYFNAAKDEKEYLKMSYGPNFMSLPKRVSFHTRMQTLIKKDVEDLHQAFVDEIERLRKVNETFNNI